MIPIDDEFIYVYPPSNQAFVNDGFSAGVTTAPRGMNFTVWRYRVTAHNQGREVLAPIREDDNPRYVAPVEWVHRYGRWVPIPPNELLPLMDESWS